MVFLSVLLRIVFNPQLQFFSALFFFFTSCPPYSWNEDKKTMSKTSQKACYFLRKTSVFVEDFL